jgi:WD40 repeat protein
MPGNETMLTWSTDGTMELHSLQSGKTERTYRLKTKNSEMRKAYDFQRFVPPYLEVMDVDMTANAKVLAYSIEGQFALFNRRRGRYRLLPVTRGHNQVVISHDGSKLLTTEWFQRGFGLRNPSEYRFVIFDARTGNRKLEYKPKNLNAAAATFSPDARLVATWCEPIEDGDGEIHIVDAESGRLLRKIAMTGRLFEFYTPGAPLIPFAFSPVGNQLATGGADAQVRLWDVKSGKRLREFQGHLGYVTTVAFSKDGTRLASGSTDSTVLVWDLGKLSE